jgi:hypothetical protein
MVKPGDNRWLTYNVRMAPTSEEAAMTEPMISLIVGIVVVLCIAVVLVARHRAEHKGEPHAARWLDTHPLRDWMRHRH